MINTVFVCVFVCLVLFVRIIEFKTETTPPKDIFYFSRERLLNLKKHKAREIFCLPFWSSIQSEANHSVQFIRKYNSLIIL